MDCGIRGIVDELSAEPNLRRVFEADLSVNVLLSPGFQVVVAANSLLDAVIVPPRSSSGKAFLEFFSSLMAGPCHPGGGWRSWLQGNLSPSLSLPVLRVPLDSREPEPRNTDEWFQLVESLPHMVWAATPEGTSNYYNQRFLDYLGMSREQMRNLGGLKAVHPEDQDRVRAAWLEAVRNVREYRDEYRICHGATGEFRWFEAHAVPRRNELGQVVRWVGTCTDIHDRKLAEERARVALEKAETERRRLEAVMRALPVGVAITNREGGVEQINEGFERVWGGTPPPAPQVADYRVYQAWWADTGQAVQPQEWASAIAARSGRCVLGQLLEIQRFDGRRAFVLNSAAPVLDAEGQTVGSAVAILDITELRAREAEARARAEELTALMDAVPAVTFIAHDPECRRMTSTQATRQLLRAGDRVNVSMSAPAAERPTSFRVLKDGRELAPEEMPVQLAAARGSEVRNFEWTLAFPDSTRQLFGNAVPLFDGAGRVRGAVGAFVDITEHKLATEALRQSEARLRMAQEAAQLGIHDWTVTANTVQWDARTRELWGVEPDLPITYDVFMAGVHPEDRASTQAAIDEAIDPAGKGHYYAEFRVIHRRDGQVRWIAATGHVTFANGRAVRLVGTVQDITRVREFQAELERLVAERTASLQQAVTQMEEFSYTVSHDLRAPLRSMQIFTRALQEDFGPVLPLQARTYVERLALSCERLDKMVVDVLTLSRVGRAEVQCERVDLGWLVQQLIEQYPGMQAPHADIQVEPLPVVLGHEPSLTQAFANLLNNAIKFVPAGVKPQVRVWSEARPGAVRIWVADNGIGVNPKYQHRLFSMFERIHPNLRYEGTGVGLAIVRKAVERMGGTVGMESDGQHGSRFWLELPQEGAGQ